MLNVSSAFKAKMFNVPLLCSAELHLADERDISLPFSAITRNTAIHDSGGASGLPLGVAICRTAELELINRNLTFDEYDLFGATIDIYGTLDLGGGSTETISCGHFNVVDAKKEQNVIKLSCADDMSKADKMYVPTITFPTTLGALLDDAISQSGIDSLTQWETTFLVMNKIVNSAPEDGYTCRDIIGYCAMYCGGNARIDTQSVIRIIRYNIPSFPGGNTVDLELWKPGLEVGKRSITITGFILNGAEYGTDEYQLILENPIDLADKRQAAHELQTAIVGKTFWRFSGEHKGIPIAECMDGCRIIVGNETYYSVITDFTYKFFSYSEIANTGDDSYQSGNSFTSSSAAGNIEARRLIRLLDAKVDNLYADSAWVENLFAEDITVSGRLQSDDFEEANDGIYAESGLAIDFAEKTIKAPDFAVDDTGKLYAKGGEVAGLDIIETRTRTSGSGMWIVDHCEDADGNPVTFQSYQNYSSFSMDADGKMIFSGHSARFGINIAIAGIEFNAYSDTFDRDEFSVKIQLLSNGSVTSEINATIPVTERYFVYFDRRMLRTIETVNVIAEMLTDERIGCVGLYDEIKGALCRGTETLGGPVDSLYVGTDGISVGDKIKLDQFGRSDTKYLYASDAIYVGGNKYVGTDRTGYRAASIPLGHVTSDSRTVFTADVPGVTELRDGVCCYIQNNGNQTSNTNWTLNVNGLGAYPVYSSLAAATRTSTIFGAGYTMLFVFNETRVSGGCWDCFYGYNSDTNTIAYNIRRNSSTFVCKTALYRYEICLTYDDETILPVNAVSNKPSVTTKALTTEKFDPLKPIYYYGTTSTVAANDSVGASYLWLQNAAVDLRYAFNEGNTLTPNKDVYLVCAIQSDGKAKLHSAPISQSLPTTADGLLYIHLGRAYSDYQIALDIEKPGYYFKDGFIRLYTGGII